METMETMETFDLELTINEINLIAEGLGKIELAKSINLFMKIKEEVETQMSKQQPQTQNIRNGD